ncbi:MAG: FkbM family methyltransferase [Clostridiales bacterium]|nr:FkbM family methyltransferase [Clostridiales bacterium]
MPNKEDHIQKIIRSTNNFYELDMLKNIARHTENDAAIIDIGANIGNHSIYFGMFCKASKVISFEPQPFVFDVFSENIKLNNLDNKIFAFQLGIGSEQGYANLQDVDPKNLGMTKLSYKPKGNVEIANLDDFLNKNFEIDNVSVLKIDVEGMEIDVLKGAVKTILKYKPFIYAEAGDQESYMKLNEFLSSVGYIKTERFNATATYLFTPVK